MGLLIKYFLWYFLRSVDIWSFLLASAASAGRAVKSLLSLRWSAAASEPSARGVWSARRTKTTIFSLALPRAPRGERQSRVCPAVASDQAVEIPLVMRYNEFRKLLPEDAMATPMTPDRK